MAKKGCIMRASGKKFGLTNKTETTGRANGATAASAVTSFKHCKTAEDKILETKMIKITDISKQRRPILMS